MGRIASFLPAATEIVCALGLGDDLVAVSHECDYPEAIRGKPVATRAKVGVAGLSEAAIDAATSAAARGGEPLYEIIEAVLEEARPDIILTQGLCGVCAVPEEAVRGLAARLPSHPAVLSLDAKDLDSVIGSVLTVARACGVLERGLKLQATLRDLARAIEVRGMEAGERPTVAALEWLDPVYVAGHWIPDMVERAGGTDVLGRTSEPSFRIATADLLAADPDFLLLMPCGYRLDRVVVEGRAFLAAPPLSRLRALREGCVFALDASPAFSRPGPRLLDGLDLLERLLHGGIVSGFEARRCA